MQLRRRRLRHAHQDTQENAETNLDNQHDFCPLLGLLIPNHINQNEAYDAQQEDNQYTQRFSLYGFIVIGVGRSCGIMDSG